MKNLNLLKILGIILIRNLLFLSYESNISGTKSLSSKDVIGFRDYFL